MDYAVNFRPTPHLPVAESNRVFSVGRIYCVGRNYAEHAREMGHGPEREPPFFFMKPADAIVLSGTTIPFPQATRDLHHEIEMVVAIGKDGADIAVDAALDHVFGYGVGLDMTRRDLQGEAKKLGRPWEMGTLRAGDLILSGTPAGVGPVKAGDRLEGHVDGVGDLSAT